MRSSRSSSARPRCTPRSHIHVDPDGAHLEDGVAISDATLETLACTADRPIPHLDLTVDEPADPTRLGQWHGGRLDVGMCLDTLGYRSVFPAGNSVAA